MSIEQEVFNRMKFDYKKLLKFGFVKDKQCYTYTKNFMDNTFRADIIIDKENKITGKVYDLELDDEYLTFRIENQVGEFVNKVREEYKSILEDIANNCCTEEYLGTGKEWIIPSNPKYFDIVGHFKKYKTSTWKQSSDINVGDIIYMYVGSPYSAILYKCIATEVNIPYEYKDSNIKMSRIMKIKLIKEYDKKKYTLNKIKKYGVTAVRGPRFMPKELSEIME